DSCLQLAAWPNFTSTSSINSFAPAQHKDAAGKQRPVGVGASEALDFVNCEARKHLPANRPNNDVARDDPRTLGGGCRGRGEHFLVTRFVPYQYLTGVRLLPPLNVVHIATKVLAFAAVGIHSNTAPKPLSTDHAPSLYRAVAILELRLVRPIPWDMGIAAL